MIGSPPGYIGYEEGGQFTELIRHRPYSVVLFDEIEKAHPDVFNVMLQVLDDGRLTDSKGRTASFKNTIIIMTSNVGSEFAHKMQEFGFSSEEEAEVEHQQSMLKDRIKEALRERFKPEFVNRLDAVIVFNTLTRENILRIVDLQLERIQMRLRDRHVTLSVSPQAKALLAERGFDPQYGARPLKRVIETDVLDVLAKKLIAGEVHDGAKVHVDVKNGGITIAAAAQRRHKSSRKHLASSRR